MITLLTRFIALGLVSSIFSSYTIVSLSAASLREPAVVMGSIAVAGEVRVNGVNALHGSTIFSESIIETSRASRAIISMDKTGSLELAAETAMKLEFSDSSLAFMLDAGRVRVAAPKGVHAQVTATDVTLVADANESALFSVQVISGGVNVSVEAGKVEVRRGNETHIISAGELFSSASDSQLQSTTQQNLSGGKKVGLVLGIGGAIALLAILISGQSDKEIPKDPCVVVLSGDVHCP